ncbi:ADP-ribosylation factor-like protein 13B isoform X2 [Cimex lectularius]|uniref:ADP-ribosylation factor-like protein 13B n=1 Tax=Cimex lectularius TaxID=79782 RepID=A0A8I6RFQ1_CIMLE|nr:ADP-ribosylation factor-like protein 13B isoform X2 [Cimex lectularius]
MGNCCVNCPQVRAVPARRKIVLLLVGLDNSGKTTAVKALSGDFVDSTVPTVGFSVVKLPTRGYDVFIYDLGGGPQIRAIWNSYFHDVHGVIFVVDASDRSRLEESRSILESLLRDEKLSGKPVLVLANKQDKPDALDEIDIVEMLKLEPLVNQQKCPTLVEICTAFPIYLTSRTQQLDQRLLRGYRWLVKQIIHNYMLLNNRVEADMKEEMERMAILREKLRQKQEAEKNSESNIQMVLKSRGEEAKSGLEHGEPPGVSFSESNELLLAIENKKAGLQRILEKKGELQQKLSNKNWKNNKVHPFDKAKSFEKKLKPLILPGSDSSGFDSASMTFRALTSPVRHLPQTQHSHEKETKEVRPTTSKSLTNEVGAWGLEQQLKVVLGYNQNQHEDTKENDTVEYFEK